MSGKTKDSPERKSSRSDISLRIRFAADKFNSRIEAAKAAGVSKTTIQTWIDGSKSPSFEALSRLAGKAGVSLDWIATGEGGGVDVPSALTQPFDRSQLKIDRELIENIVGGFSDLYDSIGLGYDVGQPISSASLYNLYDDLIQIEDKEQRSVELVRAIRMQESVALELYEKTMQLTQKVDKARTSSSSG